MKKVIITWTSGAVTEYQGASVSTDKGVLSIWPNTVDGTVIYPGMNNVLFVEEFREPYRPMAYYGGGNALAGLGKGS